VVSGVAMTNVQQRASVTTKKSKENRYKYWKGNLFTTAIIVYAANISKNVFNFLVTPVCIFMVDLVH
jgi:hypothetical protein